MGFLPCHTKPQARHGSFTLTLTPDPNPNPWPYPFTPIIQPSQVEIGGIYAGQSGTTYYCSCGDSTYLSFTESLSVTEAETSEYVVSCEQGGA